MDAFPDGSPRALADASPGAWLKPLIDAPWHDMHAVVPRGFPAYARIFHPVWRDRPEDSRTWHGHELPAECGIEDEAVGWSAVAEAFGKQMHELAQFSRLLGPATPYLGSVDAAGWRYSAPDLGNLSTDVLAAAAVHLCQHTGTPDDGVSAIWNGWGGLTSSAGYGQVLLSEGAADGQFVGGTATVEEGPGSGLLAADVVNGETLDLPGRSYFLFSAGPRFYADPGWVNHAPWHHSPDFPQSPNILWPADKKWVLVSEIDFDSTVVAGSRELIAALAQDPAIEALVLREGADLSWDADVANRPVD